jgi:hypothetical protein
MILTLHQRSARDIQKSREISAAENATCGLRSEFSFLDVRTLAPSHRRTVVAVMFRYRVSAGTMVLCVNRTAF